MNDTFMKEKPVFPLLTSMALPMVASMLVSALYNIVDSLYVARISEEAMTALSLVYPVQNFINAVAIGFSIGISASHCIWGLAIRRRLTPPRRTAWCCPCCTASLPLLPVLLSYRASCAASLRMKPLLRWG